MTTGLAARALLDARMRSCLLRLRGLTTHEETGTISTGSDQVRHCVRWGYFHNDSTAVIYERSRQSLRLAGACAIFRYYEFLSCS